MAQTINTNVSSLTAQRNAGRTQTDLATAINRLSSGLRINSAKDDAAGLAISERFTAQIRGLNQATRNANDGISLAQVAEGALGSVSTNLQRIRELAVQSANSTNSASDRAALQQEVNQLISEVQRVGTQTEFNGLKLLDGSFSQQIFQVGANAGQVITLATIADARATSLGSNTLVGNGDGLAAAADAGTATPPATVPNGVGAETGLVLTTPAGATTPVTWSSGADAKAIAAAINTKGSLIGVSAVASNAASIGGLSAAGDISFYLGGTSISARINDPSDLTALASAINSATGSTGISANFASVGSKNELVLTTSDGRDISITGFTSTTAGATADVAPYDNATGTPGAAETITSGSTTDSTTVTGKVELASSKGFISFSGSTSEVFGDASGNGSFKSLATLDIATAEGASNALNVIDAALTQVSGGRAELGAVQNRFLSTIENLQTSSENLSASRGRILDADFAQETANLARAQVLQQAGTAMIAQANQMPQQVLALLKG